MKIGIVTVLYNSAEVIEGFVDSLNAQNFGDFEVFFVENEVKNTVCEEFIRQQCRFSYEFVRNRENVGVATGNNMGIDYFLPKEAVTHILFLNNDTEFDPGFLEEHVKRFEDNPMIEALAPKIFYYGTNRKIWYAGGKLSYLKCGPRHFGHNKPDLLTRKDLYRVDYAPTCSLMVKADILRESGIRMWEQLFVYQDDYVFCKELKRFGVRMYYTPNVNLQHKIGSSTGGNKSDFSRYYMIRNWCYTLRKFHNPGILFVPLVFIFNLITGRRVENKGIQDAFRMP